jgi:hypothetical protein
VISAGLTLAALLFAVYVSIRDRRDATRRLGDERAGADKRLAEERAIADRRLADERAHTEGLRQRERQQDSARRLLEHIADLLPVIGRVPNVHPTFVPLGEHYKGGDPWTVACIRSVERLRLGGVADLPGLRDDQAAGQYRHLVHLVLTAAYGKHLEGVDAEDHDAQRQRSRLAAQDLLRYATFVRLSLEHLIEHGASLDPGGDGAAAVSYPMFGRHPGDQSLWSPQNIPTGWQDAVTREPDDPQYRPAP